MGAADTRGDDRTKPVWGAPAKAAPAGKKGRAKPSPAQERQSKAEAAREARAQAKAARLEAKAERARRKQAGQSVQAARSAPSRSRARAGTAGAPKPAGRGAPAATARATAAAAAGRGGPAKTARATAAATSVKGRGGSSPAGKPRRPASPARRTAPTSAFRKRYGVVHDIEGPRVRLGICWFLLALAGIVGGPVTTAAVYGGAAAIAAAQTARVWRKRQARPAEPMAAGGAALVTAGACLGAGGAGLGILGAVALAFVGAAGDTRSRNPRIADVGWTLQAALAPAAVGLSMVLLARLDQGSALALLLLVSAFETGDFLIGSGASNPYEGPAAGAAGIVVVTFIISTLPISTLSFGQAWLLGGAVVVLAPVGQLLASALLPTATSPASALRRLDSLLVAAPLWAWAVGLFD